MSTTIWHNPRCSKSRQTLALLEEHGEEITVRAYLDDAPSEAEIRTALTQLGCTAINLIRPGETLFKELNLSKLSDEDTLIAAMVKHPKLIERPIVFKSGRAAIGRPAEQVLDIL